MKKGTVSFRGVAICTAGLSVAMLSGCATTMTPDETRPTVQKASASSQTQYVVKRAGLSSDQKPTQVQQVVQKQIQAPAAKQSNATLTREQYHARYQAEQRAKQAEQERLRKERAAAAERQRIARENAIRQEYIAKWERNKATIQAQQKAKAEAKAKLAASQKARKAAATVAKTNKAATVAPTQQASAQNVERVIQTASRHIGTRYVWGGASPSTGFDCSGLVQHSLAQGANVRVPRTAAEQYAAAVKVSQTQAARGDLVFFKTRGNRVSHVGIYLGNGKFLHAPRAGKTITTSEISGYWRNRLVGFGRIPGACRVPIPMA